MPLYEYRCAPCDHIFETLIRTRDDVPRCPQCGSMDVAKLLSVPAAAQAGGKASNLPLCQDTGGPMMGGCGAEGCRTGMCSFD